MMLVIWIQDATLVNSQISAAIEELAQAYLILLLFTRDCKLSDALKRQLLCYRWGWVFFKFNLLVSIE